MQGRRKLFFFSDRNSHLSQKGYEVSHTSQIEVIGTHYPVDFMLVAMILSDVERQPMTVPFSQWQRERPLPGQHFAMDSI